MPRSKAPALLLCIILPFLSGCGLFITRPVQEMAYAESALRAAREVKADTLAPNLYREAYENYLKARKFYKSKNFESARKHALTCKDLSEQAEFISYRKGGAIPDGGNPDAGAPDAAVAIPTNGAH